MYSGNLTDNIIGLMNKYKQQFGDIFPLMEIGDVAEQELVDLLEKHIKENKKYISIFIGGDLLT
jgi:hypothetical protein